MADDKTNRDAQDRSRIGMRDDDEIRYWTDKLGISREQLEDAVKKVGSSPDAVEAELRRNTLSSPG